MKRWIPFVCAVTFALCAPLAAQEPPTEEPEADTEEESPFEDFEKLVEGAEHVPGFFDLYTKDGKLWMAVAPEQLGEDFLVDHRIAQGIGAGGLYGGTTTSYFEMDLMAIERRGEKLYLVQRPHRFGAPDDARARQAVELTIGSSVVESAAVAATRPDSALVIDVTDWFVSDLSGVGRQVGNAAAQPGRPGNANLDRSRSYLESVRGFPDNVAVRAKLTFRPSEPVGMPSVPDGRYVPITMHTTFARLPERPMEVRWGDDRVGNFWTVHKDFSAEDSTFFRRMVNRWRLEPGERAGERWRPVEPITYYIDPNVPDEYRPWFKAGVEAWNEAFRAAGWEGAIRALDLPEGADADDIRYATLRWNTSDQPGYGAIGPSKVDPRTGEILDADILFEANMFMGFRNTWRNLVNPATAAQAFEMALGVGEWEVPAAAMGVELPGFASALTAQGALVGALLAARGELDPGDPLPDDILRQYTLWVVMHEVGHSLGLQHNFRSSASTPLERLHDTEFTARNGVFSSVMEYPTVNLSTDGPQGDYYNQGIGSYDRWAIRFAYTPEQADANAVAREVSRPEHMYGNEAGGPPALDPTINTYDLGDDPLAWGTERSAMIRGLMDRLPDYVLLDNASFADLSAAYGQLMNEYARAIAPAVKYLGGQYLNRDHVGDGRDPFVNVPRAEQDRALSLIVDRVFAEDALALDPATLRMFGSNRWTHWGQSSSFDGRLDFPYHERVTGFQTSVLGQLLHPWRLARIRDGETKFGPAEMVTIPELMGSLTDAVWSELGGNVTATRRDLQRAYLDHMTELLVDPPERTPADARSVARWQLTTLRSRIDEVATDGLDAYTAAHLAEATARIDKALEAGLAAEG
jgi:hypothetical protein